MAKKTLKDLDVKGKKVLVRVDFNVPIKDGVITNDNRITAALPTLKYILENGGRVIAFSHLGKVKEEADKASKTLAPVAKRLEELLGKPVKFKSVIIFFIFVLLLNFKEYLDILSLLVHF